MTGIDRREFLHALGAWGLLAAAPHLGAQGTARFPACPFTLGVASGYPRASGVTLWTRLAPLPDEAGAGMMPEPVTVAWEVASDASMRSIVASGSETALAEWAHSVHVDVHGLQPARDYWYRFMAGDAVSPVGHSRTAPADNSRTARMRFAFASCQHYEQGYFGAYRHMVADDLDLLVFLGDYIYETSYGGGATVRRHNGAKAATLEDYRRRYALYKRDPDLQAAHAAFPWILTWDDHEVENDYAADLSFTREPRERTLARRAAAYKAYYEHQPMPAAMRPSGPHARIYDSVAYGDLARFHVLDTRQYRTPQPCQRRDRGGGTYLVDCSERTDPAATMLGAEQERWLTQSLDASPARWNVLAQQYLVAQLDLSTGPMQSFWTDAWDGYPQARSRLLSTLHDRRVSNPVFIGGDAHMYWVSELTVDPNAPASAAVATDITGTSITSRSLVRPWMMAGLLAENPHIQYGDCTHRGYTRVELTPERLTADLCATDGVASPDVGCSTLASFVVENGRPRPHKA
jgi:alkaline phosphatase D